MLSGYDVETEINACDEAIDMGLMDEQQWESHITRFLHTFDWPEKDEES